MPLPDEPPAAFAPTARTTVRRQPRRASYDRAAVHRILDEALVCHVGFAVEGQAYVIPTAYARVGDRLYLHGAVASRMLRTLRDGAPACVTVTLLDGLVLARSAFHHSMNYRSVVVLGTAREVTDADEKRAALDAFVDHVVPGRSRDVRPPSDAELRATVVLAMALDEVSAKVRTGPPVDDPDDLTWPCWAGEVPVRLAAAPPVRDPQLPAGVEPPPAVAAYARSAGPP